MAITIDPATRIISVPQGDLTFVTGTLYDCDTDQLRKDIFDLLSSENFMWLPDAYTHNTEVTVAGVTYARTLEMINSFSIEFTPDAQWSVRLLGSNNNFFDVENGILVQNQVQVIPTNSAGLVSIRSPWDDLVADYQNTGTFGERIRKLPTFLRYLAKS